MNISNFAALPAIIIAVLIVDLIVIFLVRYFPSFWGTPINVWYDKFGLSAVIADVLIIVLGIMIGQYAYNTFFAKHYGWNLPLFIALIVGIQVIHDLAFYFGVIKPLPLGHNAMMDVFKIYAESGQGRVVIADSAMMAGSAIIATALLAAPPPATAFIGILAAYAVPYILTTNWRAAHYKK